jgi:hypothetical protein
MRVQNLEVAIRAPTASSGGRVPMGEAIERLTLFTEASIVKEPGCAYPRGLVRSRESFLNGSHPTRRDWHSRSASTGTYAFVNHLLRPFVANDLNARPDTRTDRTLRFEDSWLSGMPSSAKSA